MSPDDDGEGGIAGLIAVGALVTSRSLRNLVTPDNDGPGAATNHRWPRDAFRAATPSPVKPSWWCVHALIVAPFGLQSTGLVRPRPGPVRLRAWRSDRRCRSAVRHQFVPASKTVELLVPTVSTVMVASVGSTESTIRRRGSKTIGQNA
jgi:hypothetical protein